MWVPGAHGCVRRGSQDDDRDAGCVAGSQARVDAVFYALVGDLAGAPQEIIDPHTGRVEGRVIQSLYGQRSWAGSVSSPLLFAGQFVDAESGWAYNRFRFYSPVLAGFNAQDPLGLAPRIASAQGYVDHAAYWVDVLGLMSGEAHRTPREILRSNAEVGNAARDALAARIPGSVTEKYMRADIEPGGRFIDVFEPEMLIGNETKTGKVGSRAFIRHQVDKDVSLVDSGQLREARWFGDPSLAERYSGVELKNKQFTKPMRDYLESKNFHWNNNGGFYAYK